MKLSTPDKLIPNELIDFISRKMSAKLLINICKGKNNCLYII